MKNMRYKAYHDKPIIHLETIEIIAENNNFEELQNMIKNKCQTYPDNIVINDTKHNLQILLTNIESLKNGKIKQKKLFVSSLNGKKRKNDRNG